MKLGILQCDDVHPSLIGKHGNYPKMFIHAFQRVARQVDYPLLELQSYAAHRRQLPAGVSECDAYLITGSLASVYDPLPWIAPLENFIRTSYGEGQKLLGICFGHQLIAQMLGGRVCLSDKGWSVGITENQVIVTADWMQPGCQVFNTLASHRDQVIELPEGAKVLAGSDFCPFYLVQYGTNILTIQGHPEYTRPYLMDALKLRRGTTIPEERVDQATALLESRKEVDDDMVIQWLLNFLLKG